MKKYLAMIFLCMLLAGCTRTVYKAEQSADMLGTTVTISVINPDKELATSAIKEAFMSMQYVNDLMNNFDNKSALSILNMNKSLIRPDLELVYVINKSLYYSRLSDGAFDITVQPMLDLYTKTFTAENRQPTDEEIRAEEKKIGYQKITIENNSIRIGQNTTITLGAIAKGYAIDQAIKVLKSKGITRAMINAGGQVSGIGLKEQNAAWVVALQNPRDQKQYVTLIELENNSVSTSGDYERYFDANKTFHHIINPKTGYSATEIISATVIAKTGIDADALSTTVFVLGAEKGLKLIEDTPGASALIITKNRTVMRSSKFKY